MRIRALQGDWLKASCLQVDQIVLMINQSPTHRVDADEALHYLSSQLSLDDTTTYNNCIISIKTCNPATTLTPTSNNHKNALRAMGGSAMVGAGAVLGLLGSTESLDGPRNATRRLRDSVSKRWRGRGNNKNTTDNDNDADDPNNETKKMYIEI